MTPVAQPGQMQPLLEALAEDSTRDGDGMTDAGRMRHLPATPSAERTLAELAIGKKLEDMDPDRIAFVGAGAVNKPLIDQLTNVGHRPGTVITKDNSSEVPQLHIKADLVISATGIAGLLGPEALLRTRADGKNPPPLTVIDSGVGVNSTTKLTHGDVDPLMYGYNGDQILRISGAPVIYPDGLVLHRGRGVGRLTVATFVCQGLESSLETVPPAENMAQVS